MLQNTLGADRTNGKISDFLRGQVINLRAINLESICRIKYALAQESMDQVFTDTNEGIMNKMYKSAANLGLASVHEVSHLVSTVRQEWDKQSKTYQYQLCSYNSANMFFVIDLGTHLEEAAETKSGYQLKWRFAQPPRPLNISQRDFVPVLNQAQVLEVIKKCSAFKYTPQLSRRKSSAAARMLRIDQDANSFE